jgi:excinuclease UvrABC nuclease subunit
MGSIMSVDVDDLRRNAIPLKGANSGIYVLFENDELVYVGEGWNCLLRVAEHTRKDSTKVFTSWNFVAVSDETERKALELELRIKFRPKYNRR